MKKTQLLTALLLFISASVVLSCSSDGGPPVDGLLINTESFAVNIGGEHYAATQISATEANGTITITGARDMNGEKVVFVIPGSAPGTYNGPLMYYRPGVVGVEYVNTGNNGSVTITSTENGKISGTFSFTGYWSDAEPIVFTNGSFRNILITQSNPVPVADGTVKAVTNGNELVFSNSYFLQADQNYIINGLNAGNMEILQISMPANIGVGTYTIGGEADSIYATLSGGAEGTEVFSLTGTLTITVNSDGVLEGTFSFTGIDAEGNTREVTGGQFYVEFQD